MEPSKIASSLKIEAKQMQFPDPNDKRKRRLATFFCNSRGENVHGRETEASDQRI